MTTYRFYEDPSHGWLRVTYRELADLGIATKISAFSYRRGQWAYLEEDSDAPQFMRAYFKVHGDNPRIRESSCNNPSRIRSYPPYYPDAHIKQVDPVLDPMRMELQRQLLKAAAGRKIFCDCGKVLDWSDTVVLTSKKGSAISCCKCWETGSNAAMDKYGQHAIDQFNEWSERQEFDSAYNWAWSDGKMTKGARIIR